MILPFQRSIPGHRRLYRTHIYFAFTIRANVWTRSIIEPGLSTYWPYFVPRFKLTRQARGACLILNGVILLEHFLLGILDLFKHEFRRPRKRATIARGLDLVLCGVLQVEHFILEPQASLGHAFRRIIERASEQPRPVKAANPNPIRPRMGNAPIAAPPLSTPLALTQFPVKELIGADERAAEIWRSVFVEELSRLRIANGDGPLEVCVAQCLDPYHFRIGKPKLAAEIDTISRQQFVDSGRQVAFLNFLRTVGLRAYQCQLFLAELEEDPQFLQGESPGQMLDGFTETCMCISAFWHAELERAHSRFRKAYARVIFENLYWQDRLSARDQTEQFLFFSDDSAAERRILSRGKSDPTSNALSDSSWSWTEAMTLRAYGQDLIRPITGFEIGASVPKSKKLVPRNTAP